VVGRRILAEPLAVKRTQLSTINMESIVNNLSNDPKCHTAKAAAYVGCSPRTLEKWRQTGGGPIYLKIGRAVVYRKSDLDRWLENCQRRSTSEATAL
jgi:predicted DNA-binding transcriptional regulator AlpA